MASQSAGSGAGDPAVLPDPAQLKVQAVQYASQARAAEDDALLLYSGIALGIMGVVSIALGWFVAGRALRPLRRITAAAQRISATNLHERLALDGPDDDLRELADTIDNALRHNVADGTVWVTAGTRAGQAVLTVANTGPVVPDGEVGRLLVPFQRGGAARSPRAFKTDGLGLGLPIVQAIAAAHGAAFSIAARPEGGGLTAELSFPPVRPAPPGWQSAAHTIDTCHGPQGSSSSCSSTLASSPR